MLLTDTDGSVGMPGTVGRGAFLLSAYVDGQHLRDYVRHKFMLYRQAATPEPTLESLDKLVRSIKDKEGVVYISNSDQDVLNAFPSGGAGLTGQSMIPISGATERFRVTRFDVNGITLLTDFLEDQFLVYTDAYDPAWQITVNGKRAKLYKANAAFKGIWLPSGNNYVELRYKPWGGTGIYVFVALFILAFGALTVRLNLTKGRQA